MFLFGSCSVFELWRVQPRGEMKGTWILHGCFREGPLCLQGMVFTYEKWGEVTAEELFTY